MSARDWVDVGTALCRRALVDLNGPSLLPGWSRRHVAAHLSLNAEALGNLVHWARTGEERPMYEPGRRDADIEAGAQRGPDDLRAWFDASAKELSTALDELTPEQWQTTVRTAQGRQLPATQILWLRAREVMVHAVDLDTGTTFADLPNDFLEALCQDIRTKRGDVPQIQGPLPELAAYLAGRPYADLPADPLPPWL